jgi:hypothetical protein
LFLLDFPHIRRILLTLGCLPSSIHPGFLCEKAPWTRTSGLFFISFPASFLTLGNYMRKKFHQGSFQHEQGRE